MNALKDKTNGNVKTQPAPGPEATTVPTGAPAAPIPASVATPTPAPPAMNEPWESWPEMQKFAEEIERVFDDFGVGFGRSHWPRELLRRGRRLFGRGLEAMSVPGTWMPRIEVTQKGNEYVVSADLPGLTKEDFKVEAADGMLTLRGERKSETEKSEKGYHHSERTYGQFFRSIPLPEGAEIEKIAATFKNGVLTVKVPTPVPKAATRQVEVKDGH